MPTTAPAVVRVARRPAAAAGPGVDQDVSIQPHESADNIVWGTLAEGAITAWARTFAIDHTGWATSVNSTTL
jgi:hypothetical protein